jgi:glutathione S-transferase
MGRNADVVTAWTGAVLRLGAGLRCMRDALGPRPEKRLELYDFEACPFCRKVREALVSLDLEATIKPCPKGGTRFRPEVKGRGGKLQFPYLVDPNAGVEMYESDDIIRHLFGAYGTRAAPFYLRLGPLTTASSSLSSLPRATRGSRARPSRAPGEPLELWNMEASPYCRLVRELLCELELPYVVHNVGKRSPSREAFVARSGKMMVPYLADPNTGAEMHESADIILYLNERYALG